MTVSGRHLDLLAPDWREIDLFDVARGLSRIARFSGQSRRAFSVAEHCLLVAELAPAPLRLAALLHDAHEAYFGDWTVPAVAAVAAYAPQVRIAINGVKARLDVAIIRRVLEQFGATSAVSLEFEAEHLADELRCPAVKLADDQAFQIENSVRRLDSLQTRVSPRQSQLEDFYGPYAPSGDVMLERWLDALKLAAMARFGAGVAT